MIVVDNGSSDGSSEALVAGDPTVEVVQTGANLGYGAAANRGIAATGVRARPGLEPRRRGAPGRAGRRSSRRLDADPTLAIAGPRILSADGTRYPSARRFPSLVDAAGHALLGMLVPDNRFTRRYRMDDLDTERRSPRSTGCRERASWPAAAPSRSSAGSTRRTSCTPRTSTCAGGPRRAGWGVAYVPGAVVTHLQGVSTARRPYRMLVAHHRSVFRFASRTERRLAPAGASGRWPWSSTLRPRRGLCARQALGTRHSDTGAGPSRVSGRSWPGGDTGKWVARAGATGGGRSYRGQMPMKWYAQPGAHLPGRRGVSVVYSRYERAAPRARPRSPRSAPTGTRPSASTSAGRSSRTSRPTPTLGVANPGDPHRRRRRDPGRAHDQQPTPATTPPSARFVSRLSQVGAHLDHAADPRQDEVHQRRDVPEPGRPTPARRGQLVIKVWPSFTPPGSNNPTTSTTPPPSSSPTAS